MRHRPKLWIAGMAGLAITMVGPRFAPAQDAENRNDQATQSQEGREGARQGGQHRQENAARQDNLKLTAHALKMAIEGSQLQMIAAQAGGSAAAAGVGADAAANRANANPNAAAVGAGANPAFGNQNPSAQRLQQHARSAFEASERLLREAGNDRPEGGSAQGRFQAAARRYANTLRSISGEQAGMGGRAEADRNQADRQDTNRDATGRAGSSWNAWSADDMASVTLINHTVCEAVDAWALREMTRHVGPRNAAIRALQSHAQQMARESQEAARSLPGLDQNATNRDQRDQNPQNQGAGAATRTGEGRGPSGGGSSSDALGRGAESVPLGQIKPGAGEAARAGGPGRDDQDRGRGHRRSGQRPNNAETGAVRGPAAAQGSIATLAQQAREIVDAVQQLGDESAGADRDRERGDQNRENANQNRNQDNQNRNQDNQNQNRDSSNRDN